MSHQSHTEGLPPSEREFADVQRVSLGGYIAVWIVLSVLTIATFLLSRIDMGPWSLVIAMTIAIIKAALVVLFFMHLFYARGTTWFSFIVAVGFVLVLIGGAVADVTNRFEPARPDAALLSTPAR
jgi:cytochrome c oxidase subunit 4